LPSVKPDDRRCQQYRQRRRRDQGEVSVAIPLIIIFRDLVGKFDVLRVECDKCGRRGRYRLDRLIEQYGLDAKLFDWEPEADCPRKVARNEHDPCGSRCPDLSKVV
jgi:hypothetical protein